MFGHTARACRFGRRIATFAALSLLGFASVGAAQAETRTLKFYNLHTHEKGAFPYKSNGRYSSSELKKINYFLRDWRKNQSTTMDPQLLDLIWEAYRQSGANGYINVICGYRSPGTNNMLRSRSRSSGVAQKSQHTLGKALDFYIPGVPLKKMREIGLKMQVGGVGYYPTSGSPFVHFDVGRARHWPRMSRSQLLAVFPRGNTVHVPSDGKPLPGYQQALASYKQRRGASDIQVANAGGRNSSGGGKTLLSFLFGGGADEADDEADTEVTPAAAPTLGRQAPAAAVPATIPAKAAPEPETAVAAAVPQSRPTIPGGVAVSVPDVFDTSRSQSISPEAEPAASTQMAMLEPARVPFPTFAPLRVANEPAAVEPAAAANSTSAPAGPAIARADAATVASLIADLQAQDANENPLPAEEQLAYAVPTPRERPAFEAILDPASSAPGHRNAATADKALTKGGVLAAPARVAAPIARETAVRVAAIAPAAPSLPPRNSATAASLLTQASTKVAAPVSTRPSRSTFAAALDGAAPAVKAGKGGRVRGARSVGSGDRLNVVASDPQDLISSRIAMATLMTDPGRRASRLKTSTPDAARLVGDVPETLYADGFSAPTASSRSDRFSGSAVTFMPVVKIKP